MIEIKVALSVGGRVEGTIERYSATTIRALRRFSNKTLRITTYVHGCLSYFQSIIAKIDTTTAGDIHGGDDEGIRERPPWRHIRTLAVIPSTELGPTEDTSSGRKSISCGRHWSNSRVRVEMMTGNVPLQTLDVLPTDFVVQHMCHLVCGNLFSRRTFVDTTMASRGMLDRFERVSTHPTIVTPIGHGALPMDRRKYESLALEYRRICM